MAKMQNQARFVLPKHETSESNIVLPWLLLCSPKNSKQRILCLGVTEDDLPLLNELLTCFATVSSCTFEELQPVYSKFPTSVSVKYLDKNASVLPYDSNAFDVAVICNFPFSKRFIPCFFSEIHRVLHLDGSLFFCFPNSLSYKRIKQLLLFSDKIVSQEDVCPSLPLNVSSCKKSLAQTGFSLPHFYSFSPDCSKLSVIRDCNKFPQRLYLYRSVVGLKKLCVELVKNTRFVRNYLETHYAVIAGKRNCIRATPSLIASKMNRELQGTSWQVWGDKFNVTEKGTFVFQLYDTNAQEAVICKIPLNQATQKHLEANYSTLTHINANQEIPVEFKEKIPSVVLRSEINGYLYFVEELKDGVPAVQYRNVKRVYDDILHTSSRIIMEIHYSTLLKSENVCKGLITTKLKLLSRFVASENKFIVDLAAFLHNSFHDHVLFVTSKGDCSANNIIVNINKEVSGVIDWDQAQEVSFPLVDIINLIESFRRNFDKKSMGQVVIELFFEGKRSELENTILREYCSRLSLPVDDFIPFAVLYWIDHIIAQDLTSVCKDEKWMLNNVILVVNYLKKHI